jgi:hypothetical protein
MYKLPIRAFSSALVNCGGIGGLTDRACSPNYTFQNGDCSVEIFSNQNALQANYG